MSANCANCGGPVFADVMRGGVGVPMCEACFNAWPILPAVFAALADGPTNDGTRTGPQPRAYMLTRDETERIIKAARAILALKDNLFFGSILAVAVRFGDSREFIELQSALDDTNIGA